MAPGPFRLRLKFILIFCLLTFILFHWYIIKKCLRNLNKTPDAADQKGFYNWIANPVQYQYQKAIAFINDFQLVGTLDKEEGLTNADGKIHLNKNLVQQLHSKGSAEKQNGFPDFIPQHTLPTNPTLHVTNFDQSQKNPAINSDNIFASDTWETYTISRNFLDYSSYLDSLRSFEIPDNSRISKYETISGRLADNDYASNDVEFTKNPAFVIDTTNCKIPRFDPWDPSVTDFIHLYDPLVCSDLPLFITPEPNGIVHLNNSVLEKYYNSTLNDVECWYWAIIRTYEPEAIREDGFNLYDRGRLQFDAPLTDDHIAVKCYFNNGYVHEQFLPLVKLKDEVEEEKSKVKTPSPLNVILLGIDSVSSLNFIRHFRKTQDFIKKRGFFDMKGYTKVADNTFPNLVPMLTGHFVEYYFDESMKDTFFFDNISLIWKDYAKKGYRTFFADDAPYNGIFNYFKRGFFEPPTDYYYRPLALAIDHSELRLKANNYDVHCLNSELETDLMYDYLINFVKTMDKRPYFAFCMVSVLTHDIANHASFADAPAERVLVELEKIGALNKSALVIFSDHGIRYGDIRETYMGKFEERMPFMYIHFPKWYLEQNPTIEKNLNINQHRLITLFDIHATMKHLLYLNKYSTEESDELGLSLLNKIPESRTCEDASIPKHFCPCNAFTEVSIHDPVVFSIAQSIVNHINGLLHQDNDACEMLELNEIKDARMGQPNEELLKEKGYVSENGYRYIIMNPEITPLSEYLITFSVQPGGAVFEGTVRYDSKNDVTSVVDVSRINQYGSQSWCVDSPKLKLYCYCKQQLI